MRWSKFFVSPLFGVALVTSCFAADEEEVIPSAKDCSFNSAPEEFLSAQSRIRTEISDRLRKLGAARLSASAAPSTVAASSVPRRNFIDEQIFGKMAQAGADSAPLTTDEEFVRRITLDVTGRIPTAQQVRDFIAIADPNKRNDLIGKLLYSPEFVDKWTLWFGDLLQNNAAALSTAGFSRQIDGRNAYYNYIRKSIAEEKSIHDIAWEAVASSGNNYISETAASNFAINGHAANGPAQDTYDMMLMKTATAFLGMAHYDCLACHNGRGHLETLSLWGQRTTRTDAWRMSAFFSRMRFSRYTQAATQYTDPFYNSADVQDAVAGQYDLNVTFGNRPARCTNGLPLDPKTNRCPPAINAAANQVTPEYRLTGAKPKNGNWRAAFADNMVVDPMFARNFANRIWKQMFNMGLVEPVDGLDPDRLDPNNPPPAPWTLQATHPELLEKLAKAFVDGGYNLREFIRIIAESSAYQLSSRFDGNWKVEYVPLFARHYPRRLDGEEVHDAIAKATGVLGKYTVQASSNRYSPTAALPNLPDPTIWAVQLPDTAEPRSNGTVANFLNTFIRGNRDTQQRSQAGSILQQLSLMNDSFVNNRTSVTASSALAAIAKLPTNDAIVEEIFLTFLSRAPSPRELDRGLNFLSKATTTAARNTAVEDMAWVAINKVDFLFSY
jgi:hypothetical protein